MIDSYTINGILSQGIIIRNPMRSARIVFPRDSNDSKVSRLYSCDIVDELPEEGYKELLIYMAPLDRRALNLICK